MVICSPAKTLTAEPASISVAALAVELSEAAFTEPLVETVTALPTMASCQLLLSVSVVPRRLLVWVQTMAPGVAPTVRTLPTSVEPPVRPVQPRLAL